MGFRRFQTIFEARPSLRFGALAVPLVAALWMVMSSSPLVTEAATPCQFQTADQPLNVALCETFDAPAENAATRSGDLNPTLWGVSRLSSASNVTQGQFNEVAAADLVGCGGTVSVAVPNDVRICGGRALEAQRDDGGQAVLAIYPKQPFDINGGRTGTVVFDVSADSEGPHSAWPEFWWTDQPVPAPALPASQIQTFARNGFGFSLAGCWASGETGVDAMSLVQNYQQSSVDFTQGACITRGSATGALNHFEVRVSASRVEVYGTDAGSSSLKLLASADVAMPLTRGLIWGVDVHYNACKLAGNSQCNHTFAWDNMGFDGPTPYRDLSFDVQDSHAPSTDSLGWGVPLAVQANGVYWTQQPTGALVTFNWFPWQPAVPDVRVNGGAWHSTAWLGGDTWNWRTVAVSIPLNEVQTGTNTIEMRSTDGNTLVSNVNLVLIAGAPVPGAASSTPTVQPPVSVTPSPPGTVTSTATAQPAPSSTPPVTGSPTPASPPAPSGHLDWHAIFNPDWKALLDGIISRVRRH